MNIPKELSYTKSHEWVKKLNEDTICIGITDYAQNAMGDIVFVNLPEEGDSVTAGEWLADIESVKSVEDVISPVNGVVVSVNEELTQSPQRINEDAYDAWIVEIANAEIEEELLDADSYKAYCDEEG